MPETSIDDVYEALCRTCDVLTSIGCRYFLAGGTLLGAVRSGDMIPHDIDFDLDCLSVDEAKILEAADDFAARGLSISKQMSRAPQKLHSFEATPEPIYCSCIHIDYQGRRIGDIYVFTAFSDGIARRFDMASGMYANAKMSIPSWYYSGETILTIRGRPFSSVREPELVLEKIYGPDWRTPLKPGEFATDRNSTSGSVPDADIEMLILHAVRQGWTGQVPDAPKWPQAINWVGWPADVSREWIFRHEPLLHDELTSLLEGDVVSRALDHGADDSIKALMRVAAARAIQSERTRWSTGQGRGPQRTFVQNLSRALPLKRSWKSALKNLYKAVAGRS